jgi:hypothetical protein
MKGKLTALLERMTRREKLLVAALLGFFAVLVLGAVAWKAQRSLNSLRADIADLESAIHVVNTRAKLHVETRMREEALKRRIQENKIGPLTTAVERLAKDIKIPDPGAPDTGELVRLPMTFPGTEMKTPLPLKRYKKKKKKKNMKVGQYLVQRDHNVKISYIPTEQLQRLLARLENSRELLFVTKLDVQRRFNLPEQVRVDMTVSTFSWPTEDLQ